MEVCDGGCVPDMEGGRGSIKRKVSTESDRLDVHGEVIMETCRDVQSLKWKVSVLVAYMAFCTAWTVLLVAGVV